jgi:hypothetical protein
MPRPLYLQGNPLYTSKRRLVDPTAGMNDMEKLKFFALQGL